MNKARGDELQRDPEAGEQGVYFFVRPHSLSREEPMAAYIVMIREKTRNAAMLDEYRKTVPATFEKHLARFLARAGRQEVLEGPANEAIVVLEFPSFEAAKAWYHSPEYQAACEHRFQGGDYRCILTEGVNKE